MGVVSEGDYGIPKGLWSSFPVRCRKFGYEIVRDVEVSEFCKGKIGETVKELEEEIRDAEI
jgi:malate/lactate dehydrogenase